MVEYVPEPIARLILQFGIILIAAKLSAEICERYLKIPAVIGELAAGVIIGPYALGGIDFFGAGKLFPVAHLGEGASLPVSPELYSIAQIGVVILLFSVGMETDIQQFFRYVGKGALVAVGGLLLPFFLGASVTMLFGFADSMVDPPALFMGAVLTATSVGISARVLSDIGRLGSPEGVTILTAAVVDDVLGILVLTVVVGISVAGSVSLGQVMVVSGKALGFWIGLTGGGLLLAKYISKFVRGFRTAGAGLGMVLGMCFFAAAMAEEVGLAMIIGAYSVGLALSGTTLAKALEEPLRGVYNVFVPVFFVVMGTLVDITGLTAALTFGLAIAGAAIVAKVVGAGVPAFFTGFNLRGAARVGFGMMPRGEVALTIAGIGLTRGVINSEIFGVAVLMTLVTALSAPPVLVRLFSKGDSGLKVREKQATQQGSGQS